MNNIQHLISEWKATNVSCV